MKWFLIVGLLALPGWTALAQDAEAVAESDAVLEIQDAAGLAVSDFLWLNRLIVVFADTERDPAFQRQMQLLIERPSELTERDVVILTDTHPLEPSEVRLQLRPRGFSIVFIDKDGAVKLRKPTPRDVREITRTIDKTELRREELQKLR